MKRETITYYLYVEGLGDLMKSTDYKWSKLDFKDGFPKSIHDTLLPNEFLKFELMMDKVYKSWLEKYPNLLIKQVIIERNGEVRTDLIKTEDFY